MTPVPPGQKIYHITHVDNLAKIIAAGELWSDALLLTQGGPTMMVGMGKLKLRRLHELSILCLGDIKVGECVPFYFCPRSVMLYLIHNKHPEIAYKGGQGPIVHLEADLAEVLAWARQHGRHWAFSLSNAAARYVEFRNNPGQFSEVDWVAVHARQWSGSGVVAGTKERKQAEFLVKDTFPWELFSAIGASSSVVVKQAEKVLWDSGVHTSQNQRPLVQYRPFWYY